MRASLLLLPDISVDETLTCRAGIVDLWFSLHENLREADLLAHCESLLAHEERDRLKRLYFERDRNTFLATRLLVRSALSRYIDVDPADWRFEANRYGKPSIKSPRVGSHISFNLTNTDGLVACALSIAHERVGVDAEHFQSSSKAAGIVARYFSSSEARALQEYTEAARPLRFLDYWTLKESYLKAIGGGLSLPLDQCCFELEGNRISVTLDSRLNDDETRWSFALLDALPDHVVAVGVDTGGAPISLRARSFSLMEPNAEKPLPATTRQVVG